LNFIQTIFLKGPLSIKAVFDIKRVKNGFFKVVKPK
jgi:hypothetical protein